MQNNRKLQLNLNGGNIIFEKITFLVQQRFRYFFVSYLLGCIASVINTGVPSLVYLVPVKFLGLVFALTAGNSMYYVIEEKNIIFAAVFRTLKYLLLSIILLALFLFLESILLHKGIDISPFLFDG